MTDTDKQKQQDFLDLWNSVHDRLARFARGMTRDAEEARDLVSDTLLLAYEHFDGVRNREAFLSYVLTIARRRHWRNSKRRSLFGVFDWERANDIRDRGSAPETSHDVDVLYRAMGELPESQREALVMFEIVGLSLEDIRAVQGGSLSGVKSRLKRGREKLQKILTKVIEPEELFQQRHSNVPQESVEHAPDLRVLLGQGA